MKQRVYKQFHKARKNEAVVVFAITLATISLYSVWGAYVMDESVKTPSPQVATVAH